MIPAFMVAGTHSGVGKTIITLGLMAALRARGLDVQPFKVGPDFIDPTHHSIICERTSRNLDTFMMGEDGVRRSFSSAIKGADVCVAEGVMGLFDGMDGGDLASSAHVAKALGLDVILVVNVHGMSRSAGAVVQGFAGFDPALRLAGVILNQVGSPRHLEMLRQAIDHPILGAIPRRKEMSLSSRHLGLEMGYESNHDIAALASLLEEHADIDRILEMKAPLPRPTAEAGAAAKAGARTQAKIAVAKDEAFCFYYQDNLDILSRCGAEIVPFSPLRDELPNVDGLYLGGGYPELYARELSIAPARHQVRRAAEDGMPIYGECGGMIYLGEELVLENGSFPMAGALPLQVTMTKKLQALGYVEAEIAGENPLARKGSTLRGHEFHYSLAEAGRDARYAYSLRRGKGIADAKDGLVEHETLGSYLHAHFSSFSPRHFVERAIDYSRR